VEVPRLAHQLAAPVDHGLDVLKAELGGLLHGGFERHVVVPAVFEVDADEDLGHEKVTPYRSHR